MVGSILRIGNREDHWRGIHPKSEEQLDKEEKE